MAYFRKIDDKWRAEVERDGVRTSKRFATKKEAELWAAEQETLIARNSGKVVYDKTVAEAIDRYVRDVSSNKATARQERMRLNAFLRDFPALGSKQLADVTTADCADWRDACLAVGRFGAFGQMRWPSGKLGTACSIRFNAVSRANAQVCFCPVFIKTSMTEINASCFDWRGLLINCLQQASISFKLPVS